MTKTCKFCGKPFEATSHRRFFCSDKCAKLQSVKRRRALAKELKKYADRSQQDELRKAALLYCGTTNRNLSCAACRFARLATTYASTVGHLCKKHDFQIGEYGTCRDFTPRSSGLSDVSFD